MRLFAAIKVSSQVSENLAHWVERMKGNPEIPPKTKWVEEKNFHFTLKFFGEIGEGSVQSLGDAIGKATNNEKSFEITLKTVGGFPTVSHPRVIWSGVEDASSGLSNLAQNIEKQTTTAGFTKADKPFSPHLTLARLNHSARPGLGRVLEKHKAIFFGAMLVQQISLLRSTLTAKGPVYDEVQSWSLK